MSTVNNTGSKSDRYLEEELQQKLQSGTPTCGTPTCCTLNFGPEGSAKPNDSAKPDNSEKPDDSAKPSAKPDDSAKRPQIWDPVADCMWNKGNVAAATGIASLPLDVIDQNLPPHPPLMKRLAALCSAQPSWINQDKCEREMEEMDFKSPNKRPCMF